MTTTTEEAPTGPPGASEWLTKKIAEREAAAAAGIPEPPRARRAKKAAATAPPPKKRSAPRNPRTPRASKRTDYTDGILGVFQLVSVPLAFAAPADALAVTTHAPGVARELNNLAQSKPEVAAALDRILAGGPYAALLAAVMPMVLQVLHNHDVIPESIAGQLGLTPKSAILAHLQAQGQAAAQAAEDAAMRKARERFYAVPDDVVS